MFEQIDKDITSEADSSTLSAHLTTIDDNLNKLLNTRADIGARQNRVELMDERLQTQEIIATKLMSQNEDVDYEEAIVEMTTQESILRAALSAGANIIQPTLVDFIK